MTRLLIGNLDCETEMAGAPGLPAHVRQLIARSALDMAVLAQPGDRLWTVEPVDGSVDDVELVSGPLEDLATADAILPWCETRRVAALRARCPAYTGNDRLWQAAPGGSGVSPTNDGVAPGLPGAAPDPVIVKRCNHRRFSFDLACQYDALLPGAAIITAIDDLESILASPPGDQWVVKSPLSAAGRDRVRRRGPELDDDARVRIGRLLEIFGELYFEPWMDRTADFGVAGIVVDTGARLFLPHRLINNENGVYRGIEPIDDAPAEIVDFAAHAGEALLDAGYRGAFGIDAFAYRTESGSERVHPLCEINARMTHGLLFALRTRLSGGGCR